MHAHIAIFATFVACLLPGLAAAKTVVELAVSPEARRDPARNQEIVKYIGEVLLRLAPGDTLVVTDADGDKATRVATLTPSTKIKDGLPPATRNEFLLKLHQAELGAIGGFLRAPAPADRHGHLARYLLSLEYRRAEFGDAALKVVYFGSPVSVDSRFSLTDRYPADSVLVSPETPFGIVNRGEMLRGADIHVIHAASGDFSRRAPDLQREKLRRFYALMVSRLGGSLGSFSGTPDHLSSITTANFAPIAYEDFAPGDGKPAFFEILPPAVVSEGRRLQSALWEAPLSSRPPAATATIEAVGITWNRNVDLDLYVRAEGDDELYFLRTSSRLGGKFLQDITTAPGAKVFETVTHSGQAPLAGMNIYVNHYSGKATEPIEVKLRIRAGGQVYTTTFRLPAGNGTRGGGDRARSASWQRVDVMKAVGSAGDRQRS